METPLSISTDREGLYLRQLTTEADDAAYFAAVDACRDHLSQYDDETAANYPTLEAVTNARTHPRNPHKIRLGIWDGETFVGSINLTPDKYGGAEVGYWLDARHTGQGYATLALQAITGYAVQRYSDVHARVDVNNTPSAKVLERAEYTELARAAGEIIFHVSGRPNRVRRDK